MLNTPPLASPWLQCLIKKKMGVFLLAQKGKSSGKSNRLPEAGNWFEPRAWQDPNSQAEPGGLSLLRQQEDSHLLLYQALQPGWGQGRSVHHLRLCKRSVQTSAWQFNIPLFPWRIDIMKYEIQKIIFTFSSFKYHHNNPPPFKCWNAVIMKE